MCQAVRKTSGTTGGLIEVEAVGNWNHIDLRHRDQFAIATVDRIPEHRELAAQVLLTGRATGAVIAKVHGRKQHALARFEAGNVFADFNDFARNVAAQDVRQLHAGDAIANENIEMIQGTGFDTYENLVFPRLRIREHPRSEGLPAHQIRECGQLSLDVSPKKIRYHRANSDFGLVVDAL